jgi:hypothetical protein
LSDAESQYWTWTLGLLTAASACLLPVGSEAGGECDDDCGMALPSSDSAPVECGEPIVAVAPEVRLELEWSAAGSQPAEQAVHDAPTSPHTHPSTRSQILAEPGPPIYLIAPSQSPPASPVSTGVSAVG